MLRLLAGLVFVVGVIFIVRFVVKKWKQYDYEDKINNMKQDVDIASKINVDETAIKQARNKLKKVDSLTK